MCLTPAFWVVGAGTSPVEDDSSPTEPSRESGICQGSRREEVPCHEPTTTPSMRGGYQEPLLMALMVEPCPMGSQSLVSPVTCLLRVLHEKIISD